MKKDNIPGFPGYYISKRGRVFSRIELKPQGNLKGSKRTYSSKWHELNPYKKKTGKLQVSLYKPNDKKVYTLQIHKLVATLYVPNPKNLPFVCHLDDIGTNNHYKNLVWGTPKDNAQMREYNHQLKGIKRSKPKGFMSGSSNSMYGSIRIGNASKYSLKEILDWYILYEKRESIKNICKLKGVPYKVMSRKIKLINSDRNKYLTYLYATLNTF